MKRNCVFQIPRGNTNRYVYIFVYKGSYYNVTLKVLYGNAPYKTISTISSKHKDLGGFIECCQDCDSRDQIGKTYDTNLYDYFVCCFGHENSNEFREARKNFIESLAAYAVISYILQIKDRHNGNICYSTRWLDI